MGVVQNLLILYSGVLLINAALAAALWFRDRTVLYRNLFFVWTTMLVSFIAQGAFAQASHFLINLAFATTFLVNIAIAYFFGSVVDLAVPWRIYSVVMAIGLTVGILTRTFSDAFWTMSLPIAITVATPLLHTTGMILKQRRAQLSTTGLALAGTCLAFCLHNIDFAFLRDKSALESLGFTIAILIVFALSITTPAVVLERVTEERSRIARLDEAKTRFFANITHELRTPLTMILAPVEDMLAGGGGELSQQSRAYVESVRRHALKLLKLITDLLDLTKIEDGQLRLKISRVNPQTFLSDIFESTKILAERNEISFTKSIAPGVSDLAIDRDLFERVVVNLIANAFKFTPKGGAVELRMRCDETHAYIEVTDTGPGIPADKLTSIFERFSQVDDSTRRRHGGSGIGLALVKEIVELHKGHISVNSQLGKGSTFTVMINLAPAVVTTAAQPTTSKAQDSAVEEEVAWHEGVFRSQEYRYMEINQVVDRRRVPRGADDVHRANVLVVEDNPDILWLIQGQLAGYYNVYVATNGVEGLELALSKYPDVIITDYMMPEMDGVTLIAKLRQSRATELTPIIMLTAKNDTEDRLKARQAGADVYLNKPFSPQELRAAVARLLERQGKHVTTVRESQIKSLEQIAAGLAHEIHNPLNYLKNALYIIGQKAKDIVNDTRQKGLTPEIVDEREKKINAMLEVGERGVQRIQMVVDLLRRVAQEGYSENAVDLEFDAAVRDVTQLMAPQDGADITLDLHLDAQRAKVRCLPADLNQAIRNLIQNAFDAAKKQVRVSTKYAEDTVLFEVQDDGAGIPPEIKDKIFSPFFSTKEPGKGMGVGLTIAQQVITALGGDIAVSSNSPEGTFFRVKLPVQNGHQVSAP